MTTTILHSKSLKNIYIIIYNVFTGKMPFFEIIEYAVNNTIFSSKDEKIICKSLLYCLNVKRYHLKHFKVDLYNNIFTKQEIKDKCLEVFSKAQFHFNNFKS